MPEEENGFYDDQEKSESLWETHRGRTIDPETDQPLNKPPPSRSRFHRQFPTSAVEPEPEQSEQPEHSEPAKEAKPFLTADDLNDLRERSRRRRERLEAETPEPDQTVQAELKPGRNYAFPDLPESLAEMALDYETLCGQLQEVRDQEAQEGKSTIKAERKILLQHEKLHKETYPAWLRKEFWEQFKKDEDRWPRKWMLDDKKIRERYEKEDVFKREIKILNYLWRHRIDNQDECIELADRIGAGKFAKTETQTREVKRGKITKKKVPVERDFVFIDELDFKKMQKELGKGYSETYVKSYHMEESARVGFLKKFKKAGPHGQMVYAIGYWSPMGNGRFRAEPFLTNDKDKEFRTALQKFTLPYLKEG